MSKPNDEKLVVAYGAVDTFTGFIDDLAKMDGAVPPHVDRSILRKMSGANQTATLATLRFMRLIKNDTDGTATPQLASLVQAKRKGEAEWREALRAVVTLAYAPIVGTVKVDATTPEKLNEAFRAAGVKAGEMLEKSVRFYLKIVQEAGGTVSPLLTARKPRGPRTKAKAAPADKPGEKGKADEFRHDPPPPPIAGGPPSGYERLPIPGRPGAYIQYPVDITERDCALFTAQIETLKVFLASAGKGVVT